MAVILLGATYLNLVITLLTHTVAICHIVYACPDCYLSFRFLSFLFDYTVNFSRTETVPAASWNLCITRKTPGTE